MGGGGMGGSGMGRRWYAGEQILFNRAAETLASERAAFEAEKKAHLELFEQQQKVHEGERGRVVESEDREGEMSRWDARRILVLTNV